MLGYGLLPEIFCLDILACRQDLQIGITTTLSFYNSPCNQSNRNKKYIFSPFKLIAADPGDCPPGRRLPHEGNNIAPGMTAEATICFTPDSLADYTDALVLITPKGQLQVPVLGRRPPPALTLPEVLDVGHVVLGGTTARVFDFVNTGGEGRFQLMSTAPFAAVAEAGEGGVAGAGVWDRAQHELQLQSSNSSSRSSASAQPPSATAGTAATCSSTGSASSYAELVLGRFRVSPARFGVQPGDQASLHVSFNPCETGWVEEEVVMVCDNCQVQRLLLRGYGSLVDVAWTEVDSRSITVQDLESALWFGEVRRQGRGYVCSMRPGQ